jgi:FixJ family two-component response regulator
MDKSTRFVVAVVDDDPRALESLADLLEAAGYGVRPYSSARTCWKSGGLADVDCLITDISMPDMSGVRLRRLALAARPELPVILITGRTECRTQYARIIEPGRYFEKPFDGEQLLAAIRRALTPRSAEE